MMICSFNNKKKAFFLLKNRLTIFSNQKNLSDAIYFIYIFNLFFNDIRDWRCKMKKKNLKNRKKNDIYI